MTTIPQKIFLFFLRLLVFLKRAVGRLFRVFLRLWRLIAHGYRQTIGFRLYRVALSFRHSVGGEMVPRKGQWIEYLTSRSALQWLIFFIAIGIMFPESKLYTAADTAIPGQKTLLYRLVGPGEEDAQLEEISVNPRAAATAVSHPWQEQVGAIGALTIAAPGTEPSQNQEIAQIALGGSAITKPIIPGSMPRSESITELPKAAGIHGWIRDYVVRQGDTLSRIATKNGISVATVLSANNLTQRSLIRPGDHLRVPSVSGLIYRVRRGDTVSTIARKYSGDIAEILAENHLSSRGASLAVGSDLIIPHGIAPSPPAPRQISRREPIIEEQEIQSVEQPEVVRTVSAPPSSTEIPVRSGFIWPTAVRRISQYFSWRHTGVDIAGPIGTPIYAAKSGVVVRSQCGWNGGYGCHIILDHGDGMETLYGHISQLLVSPGDTVDQGQTIALMGSTGHSSGPHCHFEVRVNERRVNPLQYIR